VEAVTSEAPIAHLTFRNPAGAPLPVREASLSLTHADGMLVECRVGFVLSHAQWEEVDEACLFNLKPEVRGPSFLESFEAGQDVEIEARLDARALSFLESFSEDAVQAAALLAEAPEHSKLLHTELWYALNVKQQLGPIKVGFSTSWMWPEAE